MSADYTYSFSRFYWCWFLVVTERKKPTSNCFEVLAVVFLAKQLPIDIPNWNRVQDRVAAATGCLTTTVQHIFKAADDWKWFFRNFACFPITQKNNKKVVSQDRFESWGSYNKDDLQYCKCTQTAPDNEMCLRRSKKQQSITRRRKTFVNYKNCPKIGILLAEDMW